MRKKICLWALALLLVLITAATIMLHWFWRQPVWDLQEVDPPAGSQLLTFPIDNGWITAGYQNRNYLEKNGYPHYGIDVTTTGSGIAEIRAAGSGTVLGTERCSNNLGYIAVIRHDDVFVPGTGRTLSLIGRYYHMNSLGIREGDRVSAGQVIGTIDRSHEWYNHIHLELDTDLEYPFHTPQVAQASSGLLHRYPANGEGILEPIMVLAVGDGQKIAVHPNSQSCTEKDEPRFAARQTQKRFFEWWPW